MNRTERLQLIDEALEGVIDDANLIRLEAELTVDAEARRDYYQRVQMTLLLETLSSEVATKHGVASGLDLGNPTVRSSAPWRGSVAAVLATAALLVFAWFAFPNTDRNARSTASEQINAAELQSSGYAVVAMQAGARWADGVSRPNGTLIVGKPMTLESGSVHLEFFSGVSVVLEGEAQFVVRSPMELHLDRGRVRAEVPGAAKGFRVRTAAGEAFDLGTVFGIDATPADASLHVLDGEVRWNTDDGQQVLKTGESVSRNVTGQQQRMGIPQTEFLSPDDVAAQAESERSRDLERWRSAGDSWKDDPRLVLFYRCHDAIHGGRRLSNLATQSADASHSKPASNAAIVGARRSSDRWGQLDGALDFSPAGSRVRTSVIEPIGSLTLACWVRIHSLDRQYNSLFLTDGHDLNEPHWQIMKDGRLFFSVKKNDVWDADLGQKDKHIFFSSKFWDPSLSGRWIMIATTYDTENQRVRHFIDGEMISEEPVPLEYLVPNVQIGNASIGNWDFPERDDPGYAVRNLNGSMDEFMLWKAALSIDEVADLYRNGRPSS